MDKETYECVNCSNQTNGDFMCEKCGNVLCESCCDDKCMDCQDREQEEKEEERWNDFDIF